MFQVAQVLASLITTTRDNRTDLGGLRAKSLPCWRVVALAFQHRELFHQVNQDTHWEPNHYIVAKIDQANYFPPMVYHILLGRFVVGLSWSAEHGFYLGSFNERLP